MGLAAGDGQSLQNLEAFRHLIGGTVVSESGSGFRFGDDDWNRDERNETPTERLDRNWGDLLQELRVVQAGVQLLTGFLLTLPFQQRFVELSSFDRAVYLVSVSAAVIATGLLIAPVMMHRLLFRRRARAIMVDGAHRLAILGSAFLGLAMVSVVLLIFNLVAGGNVAGAVAGVLAAVMLIGLWLVMPLSMRR